MGYVNKIKRIVVVERCDCNKIPIPEKFEFEIPSIKPETIIFPIEELTVNKDLLTKLKQKIICDYYNILDKLECGIQPDLQILLEEISLVETYE